MRVREALRRLMSYSPRRDASDAPVHKYTDVINSLMNRDPVEVDRTLARVRSSRFSGLHVDGRHGAS